MQTSTAPVHPDTQALNEQTRLHLNAVQQIILDNNKPTPSMPPAPVRVPVRTSLSGRVRPDARNPFANQISPVQHSPSSSRLGLHELLRSPSVEREPQSPIDIRERIRRNSVAPLEPLNQPITPMFVRHPMWASGGNDRRQRRLLIGGVAYRREFPQGHRPEDITPPHTA